MSGDAAMLAKGTTALVTGGSGGIGSALVRMLAGTGVHTIALSNDREKLALLDGIEKVETVFMDVTDAEGLRQAFSDRPIDILVNAAGVLGITGTLYSVPHASAQRIVDVNVVGVHNCL